MLGFLLRRIWLRVLAVIVMAAVTLLFLILLKKLKRMRMEREALQQQLATITVPASDPADPAPVLFQGKVVNAGGAV
ncbi:hypothetical protein A2U01_0047338 [Trifolium medium]|uniref:Uncharacterized protein n=1 Tax=Trifolium medium TaxID=97028 RepID=A0A392QP16_9FABA|nr:hypothetical protein [Trifolium medium]